MPCYNYFLESTNREFEGLGSILPCCLSFGNAAELQILRCQGFEVKYYDFTLDALTRKPSDVCNVGVAR
jgi:hypothetical protein